jgi:hypothetical protein
MLTSYISVIVVIIVGLLSFNKEWWFESPDRDEVRIKGRCAIDKP